ncbi:DUF418 domain-containing protein [Amycolatopsis cihanbeyliensis]|uniref:DUF418 domain-containing protein n=1 Tax=Amycolatopsis cihanbeyliensis TaxID=1128664 RepID=A0A542DH95_AMYCI|nr:DUF418 domain-containing protein [Amycolatopsis cihanbeyliensis]TQJ02442.1 uncharacterized protein FB471_2171 [Amycolatopsis cihanbeyliensis]
MLRGFAVFGILVANIEAFVDPGFRYQERAAPGLDGVLGQLVAFLAESRFYVLFAFLFGYGLALQLNRPYPLGTRMARRLLLLFGIGAVHAVLLFSGDILMIYALAGTVLYLLRKLSARGAFRLGFALLALFAGLLLLAILTGVAADGTRPSSAAQAEEALRDYRSGFEAVVARRVDDLQVVMAEWWTLVPIVLGYFLFGLAAGKIGLPHRRTLRTRTLIRACALGFAVGVPPAALFAFAPDGSESWEQAKLGLGYFTAPALSIAYAAALILFGRTRTGNRVHALLAGVGRTALSNYLLQSLICAFLFTGYGAALAGQVGNTTALGIVLVIYLVQVMLSTWWLRRHAFGPAEWLLRSFTYLRRQPWLTTRPAPPRNRTDPGAAHEWNR